MQCLLRIYTNCNLTDLLHIRIRFSLQILTVQRPEFLSTYQTKKWTKVERSSYYYLPALVVGYCDIMDMLHLDDSVDIDGSSTAVESFKPRFSLSRVALALVSVFFLQGRALQALWAVAL